MTNTSEQANHGVQGCLKITGRCIGAGLERSLRDCFGEIPGELCSTRSTHLTQYKIHLCHGETVSKVKHPHSLTIMKLKLCGISPLALKLHTQESKGQ